MRKIITMLFLGAALVSTTLFAQNSNSKKADDSRPTFSVRKPGQKNLKSRIEEPRTERKAAQEAPNPAMAYRAGNSPWAPLVCRHDDLSKDSEFRQCTDYLMDHSGSFRPQSQFPSDAGE